MMTLTFRNLTTEEASAAADIHRRAGASIPDYDTSLHSREEYVQFYEEQVLRDCTVLGAFDDGILLGLIATRDGWIDHLYIEPGRQGQGIGGALVGMAQQAQDELRLFTFQSNVAARGFYERLGFIVEELTDGQRNEEKMPDVTYLWSRGGP
jgi:ribosomal protein S18 acetylase RimI-like enzyme